MRDNTGPGPFPVEELAELNSEVRHLKEDLSEHRIDTRERIRDLSDLVGTIKRELGQVGKELHTLGSVWKWAVGVVGGLAIAVIADLVASWLVRR